MTQKPYFLVPTRSPAAPMEKSINYNNFMRNKPNLCVFWAVSGDCEEKQSQTNPIQSQSNPTCSELVEPISQRKTGKIPCSTVNCSTALLSQAKGLPQTQSCRGVAFLPPRSLGEGGGEAGYEFLS